MVRIRESVGQLVLVNAREPSELVDQLTQLGFDIDQGIVLKLGDQLYYGAEAMQALALISSSQNWFNRLNYWLFKNKAVAKFMYPILRCGRNLLLKVLGKTKINNLDLPDNHRF